MNYQLHPVEKITLKIKISPTKNRRKRFSCWHCGVLSSEQWVLWLRTWTQTNVYSADSNPFGLLKVVHSNCKYAQIGLVLRNMRGQDVEEMMKCLCNMNTWFFSPHNLLSAQILPTAYEILGADRFLVWLFHFLYPSPTCISQCSFSFRVLQEAAHFFLSSLWFSFFPI